MAAIPQELPQDPSTLGELVQVLANNLQVALQRLEVLEQSATQGGRPNQENRHGNLPKPRKPDVFTGDKNGPHADIWCFQLQTYFQVAHVREEDRVTFAVTLLREPALMWWMDHVKKTTLEVDGHVTPTRERITTFEDFSNTLKDKFMPITRKENARDRLAKIKQTTSVLAYITAFQRITMQIPNLDPEEEKDRFFRGLKHHIQREITLKEPPTLEDMQRMAVKLDQLDFKFKFKGSNNDIPSKTTQGPSPMELDAMRVAEKPPKPTWTANKENESKKFPSGKLTPDLKAKLLKEGGCFYCREKGHLALKCPKKASKPLN